MGMSLYEHWYCHFLENRDRSLALPWHDSDPLSAAERGLVGRAIQQFQLGEWGKGRGLVRRASAQRALASDPWFLPSLELFIAEEQAHSEILGRFLDREGVPRLRSHWLDAVFRRLRKLAGLEVSVMVLVTAEVLAMPFYQALRDATGSQLLRAICWRIICDEAAHVNFQALTIGLVRRPILSRSARVRSFCHSMLFQSTALLLWQQHRRLFRAAGWDFRRFWKEARRGFARLQFQIRQASVGQGCSQFGRELRLSD